MIFFESDWIIISTVGENKSHVPNHQPAIKGGEMSMVIDKLYIYMYVMFSDMFSTVVTMGIIKWLTINQG